MFARATKTRLGYPARRVANVSLSCVSLGPRFYASAARPLGADSTIENNIKTETNRLEKTLSKFWEKVGTKEAEGSIEIQLDGKTMKTPLGFKLALPSSKKTLAHLVANEWKNVPSLAIRPHSLPLTSLVSRVIDLENSRNSTEPDVLAKVGKLEDIKEDLLRYLDTDTLLVFSPKEDCDGTLRPAQEEMYRPIISSLQEYVKSKTGAEELVFSHLDCDVGLIGNSQSEETRQVIQQWMDDLNLWQLVALEKTTLTAKSFLSGIALLRMHDKDVVLPESEILELEDIARAATLETIYQTERWGEVEDTHDVDKVDVRRNLASASLIVYEP